MKMNTEIFLMLALAGIAVAFQTGVNGALGRQIGTIEASFTSFVVDTTQGFEAPESLQHECTRA